MSIPESGTKDFQGKNFRTDPKYSYEEKRVSEKERAKSAEELEEWFKQLENRRKNRENK